MMDLKLSLTGTWVMCYTSIIHKPLALMVFNDGIKYLCSVIKLFPMIGKVKQGMKENLKHMKWSLDATKNKGVDHLFSTF